MILPNIILNRPRSRPQTDEMYSHEATLQWWYFDAVLENGYRLMTFFLPRFLGMIDGHDADQPMVNIVLRKPDGETIRERRFFNPLELSASQKEFEAAFGNECSLVFEKGPGQKDLGRYLIKAKAGRLGYGLELTPDLPPWSPTSASGHFPHVFMMALRRSLFTRDYFHYVPFVPKGKLEGWITLDGKPLDARGIAYHEQGRINFDLSKFVPAWHWQHIEHPPWTILSGTAGPVPYIPKSRDGVRGGIAFIQKEDRCLMAAFDVTGLLVNWNRIVKRDPHAQGEKSMAWEASVRFLRPGLIVRAELISKGVLEYLPFEFHEKTPVRPYWGQTICDARVEIFHRLKRIQFRAEGILETMVTGGM